MRKKFLTGMTCMALVLCCGPARAQFISSEAASSAAGGDSTLVLALEDALKIALSENVAVKVADKEIERSGYAKKGAYASLLPQIDGSASYQRTIKKQVMYMDGDGFDISGMFADVLQGYLSPLYAQHPGVHPVMPDPQPDPQGGDTSSQGFEVGRWNTFAGGLSASMPLVNAQLWQSLKISGQDVELAVEKARSSRLEMVTQVKQAFFSVLLAKEAAKVYDEVYQNAVENFRQTEKKYNVQKASELEYTRAKATMANAIPNLYESESAVVLALWQLKAVMGIDLDTEIDVAGNLMDYSEHMFYDIHENDDASLENNSTMRQLAIQAEEVANSIKMQKYAYLPSLALSFAYTLNAMENDFKFSEYHWNPYSYVGISLAIPIFSGGKRLNNVRQAQVQYDELQMQVANTERQLKIAIRQYLNQMETSMKSYASAQEAVETARKAYSIASKSYNLGRSTITDLNDAQLALTQSQLGLSQAVYNFVIAKANLEQTLGVDFNNE